jgi:hypothetical protein
LIAKKNNGTKNDNTTGEYRLANLSEKAITKRLPQEICIIERIGDQSNVASSVRGRALPAMQETKM